VLKLQIKIPKIKSTQYFEVLKSQKCFINLQIWEPFYTDITYISHFKPTPPPKTHTHKLRLVQPLLQIAPLGIYSVFGRNKEKALQISSLKTWKCKH
jgi:hypothetical protein